MNSSDAVLPEGSYLQLGDGLRLHYLDMGEPSAEPVIFLHGSGPGASGWSNFQGNAAAFRDAGHRVLIPDLPGFGFSDKPEDVDYHLDFFVRHVLGFMEALDIASAAFVGNSLGGAIAMGVALEAPERVSALVLMAPGGLEDRERYFEVPAMVLMRDIFSRGIDRRSLGEFLRSALVHDADTVDEALLDQRWQVYQLQNDQVMKTMIVPNMSARLGELTCPVLALWGAEDRMIPESGFLTLAHGVSDIVAVMVSGCGHWVMAEHPVLFNRTVLDFLSGASRRGRSEVAACGGQRRSRRQQRGRG
jgi:4,5:9,10-diseco-3-hydroxy-5,9,17-trioxoandrosta-1(10),2-diene-4-oate hydrolase